LVIGSIGLAFSEDNSTAPADTPRPVKFVEPEISGLPATPVAFYAETLELIAPPPGKDEPPPGDEATGVLHVHMPKVRVTRASVRSAGTAVVIVNRRNKGVQVYRVQRER
jgi:hypothetical protein